MLCDWWDDDRPRLVGTVNDTERTPRGVLFTDVSGYPVTVEARPSGELRLRRPLADDTIATPLVVGHLAARWPPSHCRRFPTGDDLPAPHDRADTQPVLLHRAIEFIDANVIEDIGGRYRRSRPCHGARGQYMFRRHLDTTPLRYLREVRLHYAHEIF